MNKKIFVVAIIVFAMGCGRLVEVPPAHVGRVLNASGYQKGLKKPSRFRLSPSLTNPPKLVLVEVADNQKTEPIVVYMPKDKLNLTFDVRGTFAISSDNDQIDSVYDRLSPSTTKSGDLLISFDQIYVTYAQQVIRTLAREVITEYTIQQVMENRGAVSDKMWTVITEELKSSPITARRFGLAKVQPPEVIINAQEAAAKREIEISEAEADKLVKLTEAGAALEVAKKQQEVDLIEAETQVLVNLKLAEGVNEAFVTQRSLKILEAMAKSKNKIFLIPTAALTNPSIMIGLNSQILRDLNSNPNEPNKRRTLFEPEEKE